MLSSLKQSKYDKCHLFINLKSFKNSTLKKMSTEVIYTLLYLLFCFFIVYPSDELISAGLTMPDLLHNFLGSESEQFVQYHIKRSSLTIFIYSLLPSGYFLGSLLLNENEVTTYVRTSPCIYLFFFKPFFL